MQPSNHSATDLFRKIINEIVFDEGELDMSDCLLDGQIKPFANRPMMADIPMEEFFVQPGLLYRNRRRMIKLKAFGVPGL